MAIQFTAASAQALSYGDISFFEGLLDFSMHILVNLDDIDSDHYLTAKRQTSPTARGFLFLFDNVDSSTGNTNTYKIFIQPSGIEFVTAPSNSAIAKQWQSVGFSRQSDTSSGLILYVDGVNVGEADAGAALDDDTDSFRIGDNGEGVFMNGSLAEAAIWNAALSADEFAMLANRYSARFVRPQNLIFYAPLIRRTFDVVGGLVPTEVNNPTAAPHAPIIYPMAS